MPTFANTLPPRADRKGYDLRRTPPDRTLVALITSDKFYVVATHYWGGRTVPCEGEHCKACEANSPTRTHVYLTAVESKTHDHFIFECTAKAALPIEEYGKAHGTLRGCLMRAHRPKRIKNGGVEICVQPIDLTTIRLPAEPNIPKALCVIWQIPDDTIEVTPVFPVNTILTPDTDLFQQLHGEKPNGNGRKTKPQPQEATK
jgi:hypothetical protein